MLHDDTHFESKTIAIAESVIKTQSFENKCKEEHSKPAKEGSSQAFLLSQLQTVFSAVRLAVGKFSAESNQHQMG